MTTHDELIASIERLNEYKAQRRGLELREDEALKDIEYCNQRRPFVDELIGCMERKIETMKLSKMKVSDKAWMLKGFREWINTL